ncbi:MAG: NAD(P)/FAD-dependent oxidoreductase, partial [Clostridia bacterium]|nr:NAD(P)/FAD-dependent oxidoreductase [Clostridia bacterium]
MYDVAIIGGGVIGALTARTLSQYRLKICILEKENDVACGTTKANSAIVHAGFDAKEGSLKAKLNVEGSRMMPKICKELGVKYKNNGALVLGYDKEDREHLEALLQRGRQNGVEKLYIAEKEELKAMEPNLAEEVTCALVAPTSAIVCPYELTVAAVGNAMDNGAELIRNFKVDRIDTKEDHFTVFSGEEKIEARFVVNCAGLFSDQIARLVGDDSFYVTPRKGEYMLLDKECGSLVSRTIFRTPTKMGKGILVSPTVDGNLLLGPTSVDMEDKELVDTTREGLDEVQKKAFDMVQNIPFGKVITSFCGLRSVGSTGDFILTSPKKGFYNAGGVESPGLSSAPAIAKYITEQMKADGLLLEKNEAFNPIREAM